MEARRRFLYYGFIYGLCSLCLKCACDVIGTFNLDMLDTFSLSSIWMSSICSLNSAHDRGGNGTMRVNRVILR